MRAAPEWLMPMLAGVMAALLVVLLARSDRTSAARPSLRREPFHQSRWPSLLIVMGLSALAGWLTERPGPTVALMAIGLGVTRLVRSRRRQLRAAKDEQDAVEAIGSASRALRAGIPLSGMLQILADESRGETRAALREVLQRESMGEELSTAVRQVLLRSPLAALRAFGLALTVQLSAGGNLAATTDRLAMALVERTRVRRRARTIVAYSRTAANVLAITPVVAIPILASSVDGYATMLLDRPQGNLLLGVAATMLVTGLIAIQRLSRIERLPDWGTS